MTMKNIKELLFLPLAGAAIAPMIYALFPIFQVDSLFTAAGYCLAGSFLVWFSGIK